MANAPFFYLNPPPINPDTSLWGLRNWFTRLHRTIKGLSYPVKAQTTAFTINPYIFFYPCNTTSAGFTATLPPAVSCIGKVVVVKKVSSDGNTLTLGVSGSDTIDGASTKTTTTQYASWHLISDGVSNWYLI